jgi:Methylamine utilisation protein MauE
VAAVTYVVVRTALGVVLVWAGAEKALRLRDFVHGLAAYRVLPPQLAPAAAVAVVCAELAVGGSLLAGLFPVAAAAAAIAVFAAFGLVLALALARGSAAPCHCFGSTPAERISVATLLRAVLLAALAGVALGLALAEPAPVEGEELLAALTISAGLVMTIRLLALVPTMWAYYRTAAVVGPTQTRRVSFKHQPLEVTLRPPAVVDDGDGPGPALPAGEGA